MAEHNLPTAFEKQRGGKYAAKDGGASKGEREIEQGKLNDMSSGDCASGTEVGAAWKAKGDGDVPGEKAPHE